MTKLNFTFRFFLILGLFFFSPDQVWAVLSGDLTIKSITREDGVRFNINDTVVIFPGQSFKFDDVVVAYKGYYPWASYTSPPSYAGYATGPDYPAVGIGAAGVGYIPDSWLSTWVSGCTPSFDQLQARVHPRYASIPNYDCVVSFWPNDNLSSTKTQTLNHILTTRSDYIPTNPTEGDCFLVAAFSVNVEVTSPPSIKVCIRIPSPDLNAYVGVNSNQKTLTLTYDKTNGQQVFSPDNFLTVKNTGETESLLGWDSKVIYNPSTHSRTGEFLIRTPSSGTNLSAGATNIVNVNTQGLSVIAIGTYDNAATIEFTGINLITKAVVRKVALSANLIVRNSVPIDSTTVDIKTDRGDGAITVPYNQPITVSWGASGGAVPNYSNCNATGDWSGSKTVTGSFLVPVQPATNHSLSYTISCTALSGASTTDSVVINYYVSSSLVEPPTCQLNVSAGTITVGQSVNWSAISSPNGLLYFWHVSGTVLQTDIPGEGTGKTNWSGSYTYNTAGTYDVYFHAAKDGQHDACKSNTVRLVVNQQSTVSPSVSPTVSPSGNLSCSAPGDTSAPYTTRATVGNGQVGFGYNWSTPGNCSVTNRETNDGSGGSGHWIDLSCGSSPGKYNLSVTEAATGKLAQCIFSACSGDSCEEEAPPNPGPLKAATDGRYDDVDCGLGVDEEGSPIYCKVLAGSWQDPLNGTSPFNGIDLMYDLGKSWVLVGDRVDFDCTNDGMVDGTVSRNSSNQNMAQIPILNLCGYPSAGTHTAIAKVYNGGALVVSDTATIAVVKGNGKPTAGGSGGGGDPQVTQPNYCASGPAATVSWIYSDPDGDPQAYYQVQIDDRSDFSSPEVDSGKVNSSGNSYASGTGLLQFNTTHKARVRVWDFKGAVSSWAVSNSWTTPKHAYPQPNFTWDPANSAPGRTIQFTDQTSFFDGGGVGQRSWLWNFGDNFTANIQNPTHVYPTAGNYVVNLTTTDKDNYTCAISLGKTVTVKSAIPIWKEVSPKP